MLSTSDGIQSFLTVLGDEVKKKMEVPLEIYQEIASFLVKSDIDNLRLAVGGGVFLPDRLWQLVASPPSESEYMRNVKKIQTNLIDFDVPSIEQLEGPNMTDECINRHKSLRVLRSNRDVGDVDLPRLDVVSVRSLARLDRHKFVTQLHVYGYVPERLCGDFPNLVRLEIPSVSCEFINRHKALRVLLLGTIDIDTPILPDLEVLRVRNMPTDCLNRLKNLRVLLLMNDRHPADFDLPNLEVLVIYKAVPGCINRHKKLRLLRVDSPCDFDLPRLEVLTCGDVTDECINRHQSLRKLCIMSRNVNQNFWLPNLEMLDASNVPRECIERHTRLRGLNIYDNREITDLYVPSLEALSIHRTTQECVDRHKNLRWFVSWYDGILFANDGIPNEYRAHIHWYHGWEQ